MQQQQPFVYRPNVKYLDNIARGIEDTFKPIIDKKIQDFEAVKTMYGQIEQVKKDLNRYNSDAIIKEASDLQVSTANVIKKNGKIDQKSMAEIQSRLRGLAIAKEKSKYSADLLEEGIKEVMSKSSNIKNPHEAAMKMRQLASDPELLFGDKSMQEAIQGVYYDNLNTPMVIHQRVKDTLNTADTSIEWTDANGNLHQGTFKKTPYTDFDTKTGKVILLDNDNFKTAYSNILDDKEMGSFVKNEVGSAMALGHNPTDDVYRIVGDALIAASDVKINKTTFSYQIEKGKWDAEKSQFAAENAPEEFKLKQRAQDTKDKSVAISAQRAATDAAKFGLSLKKYKSDLKDSGYTEQPNGSLIYNKNDDKVLKRKIESGSASASGTALGDLINGNKAEPKENPTVPKADVTEIFKK